jgi:hypothetical protein
VSGAVGLYLVFRNTRELLYMTPLGNNRYQLEETSMCGVLRYGDTLETYQPSEDGSVRYRRMVKRSGLKTHSFVLSRDVVESVEMSQLIQRIHAQGGHCERIAGGMFFAHIPKDLNMDIGHELKQLKPRPKSQ